MTPSSGDVIAALRTLAAAPNFHAVLASGVLASAATLTAGITRNTRACHIEATLIKHRARLRAALLAMADTLDSGAAL